MTENDVLPRPCKDCGKPADQHSPDGPIEDHEWVCDTCGRGRYVIPSKVIDQLEELAMTDRRVVNTADFELRAKE